MIRTFAIGCAVAAIAGCATAPEKAASAASKPESPAPFRATGNEPGWRLDIGVGKMTLLTNNGQTRFDAETPRPETTPTSWKYTVQAGGKSMVVTIQDRSCTDTMSGMPHPNAVAVDFEGKALQGCGGDPAALLRGAEWLVVEINGAAVVPQSKVNFNFNADGRVSGQASCNGFFAGYAVTGEGLEFTKAGATMMMCDEASMRQETLFLGVLNSVKAFSISPDGALVLLTGDGRAIKARRAG